MAVMRAEAQASRRGGDPAGGLQRASAPGAGAHGDRRQLERLRDRLITAILAEAVALLILLVALTAQEPVGWRVGILVGVWLFAVAWTVRSDREASGGRQGAPPPAFAMVVGVLAFLAWSTRVLALADLDPLTFIGPLIVAVSAGLIYAARLRVDLGEAREAAIGRMLASQAQTTSRQRGTSR